VPKSRNLGALTAFNLGALSDLLNVKPMEAEPVDELPSGKDWHYEPKYDGFRCIALRDGEAVRLQSRNQKPLDRCFPELAEGLLALPAPRYVLDGEIVIPGESFETLQLRLHPAASRVETLAAKHPARLIAFDMLADIQGRSLLATPFAKRRAKLQAFMNRIGTNRFIQLSKATRSVRVARGWLGREGLDGIVAKRLSIPYQPGQRDMVKFKVWKTIYCVVGGLYRKEGTDLIDSLLLGLYDKDGKLNYVGRARVYDGAAEVGKLIKPLIGGKGFTGRAPGGKSRWSGKERNPVPLKPVLVAEVSADHITDEYMRHGARILRWRDDKPPEACTMDQIEN
jgi:ATP-dependent DNA ligase